MINDTNECSYICLVYWEHTRYIQLSIYDSFGYTYSSPLITHRVERYSQFSEQNEIVTVKYRGRFKHTLEHTHDKMESRATAQYEIK
jgi:hypothetical protein